VFFRDLDTCTGNDGFQDFLEAVVAGSRRDFPPANDVLPIDNPSLLTTTLIKTTALSSFPIGYFTPAHCHFTYHAIIDIFSPDLKLDPDTHNQNGMPNCAFLPKKEVIETNLYLPANMLILFE